MPVSKAETARFLAAWMRLRQIVQAANFNRFQGAGLSATQFMTLNVVPDEGVTLTDLARQLNLSPASLNKTVDSLEERGFLRRARSHTDARKVNILSTRKGKAIQNSASQDFHRFLAGLLAALESPARSGLLSGLEQLVSAASAAAGAPATSGPTGKPGTATGRPSASTRRAGAAPPAKRSSPRSPRP